MTLTPAYGRDYKSQKDVKSAWEDGKDFVIADLFHPDNGRYINKQDAVSGGIKSVNIRYKKLTQICSIRIS